MISVGTALVSAAVAIVILMIGTWLVSVALRNASIVDITWGFGFVMVAWVVRLQGDTNTTRQLLERSLRKRKPGYEEYVARTSAFLPRPPRTP